MLTHQAAPAATLMAAPAVRRLLRGGVPRLGRIVVSGWSVDGSRDRGGAVLGGSRTKSCTECGSGMSL